jgi:hypothetical protein
VAPAGEERHHPLARAPGFDPTPQGHDPPGAFEPRDVAFSRRRQVESSELEEVGVVEGRGLDFEEDLPGAWLRVRDLTEPGYRSAGALAVRER